MTISLETIKSLRERTGASLQACKGALEEAGSNEEAAIEILRKKGESKAASRNDRDTNEGVVVTRIDGNKGILLRLGCETDFVAKTEDFVRTAESLAEKFLTHDGNYDATAELAELGQKMGEKIEVTSSKILTGETLGDYIHSTRKLGALTVLEGASIDTAKEVAMHIAAMNPLVISPEEISEESVAKERVIWTEQLKNEGKPAEMIGRIMMGKERKFREENALLKQAFVKNPDQTVEQLLGSARIKAFVRVGH